MSTNTKKVNLTLLLFIATSLSTYAQDYKNPKLSVEKRVADLLKRMTLEEKVAQLQSFHMARPRLTNDMLNNKTKMDRNDGDMTKTTTISLKGKPVTRISKTSKRTIKTTASWSNNGKILTIVTLYSYTDNPGKTEYTNTEVWELTAEGNLKIVKTSDADVTDDWSINATYRKAG